MGLSARYQRVLAARGDVFTASYTGLDAWAPLTGMGLSHHDVRLGLDAQAWLSRRLQLSMGYDREWAAHQRSRAVDAHMHWAF